TLSNGAAYADLDLDGDLDIVVNNLNDYASVYENNSSSLNNHKSISITLNYKDKNLRGIGSKVYVHTEKTVQYKQLFSSRGFISSIEPKLHFGLSENNNIDSIIVVWPDQVKQKIQTKITDKEIVIDYKNTDLLATSDKHNLHPPLFEKVNLISHKHTEDNYNDFDIQKLIPYKVSTQGPAVAIEDINNDGIDDIYIGSASYKKSKLFIGTSDGYREIAIPEIEKDSISEDIDAIFVDIDNDNDLDLVVGSGTISKKDSLYLNDRVYINKRNNTFTKMNDFPQNRLNTAVLSPYDYDDDGDTDIFVGNRSNPSNFGEKVNSYILKNIGNGRFEKDPNFSLNSMVTNAIWSDINNDNIKDLLVATEWDYPRVYINNNGNMSEIKGLESLLGLWQSITSYDIDNDGDKDIILGNWGLNTKFRATPSKPIKMYYSDFDQNGQTESILSHYKQNQYYTINSKDELASQLPIINKLYPDYLSFSEETTDNFIKKLNPSSVEISEVNTLASGYILNNENTFNNFIEFPKQLQLTTINCFLEYDFNKIGKEQLLTAGNFNGLNTYHGAFNSKSLFLISPITNQKKPIYQITPELNSDFYGKQIEKNYLLKRKKETYLLTIPNNDSIKIYKINSTKIN
ncbi:FG-GAP-like repeat-containing protein, partial [Aquimarina litoralis]|uniref:FG-GAP-like repeat-containing protein n=1 Tax=Aquimarina litoralis TaxID=584605 RepID=UPI001C5A07F0